MRFEKWQTYQMPAIVQGAIRLFELMDGRLENTDERDSWRDDSFAGKSAVYAIQHGYRLGEAHEGLTIKFTENWAEGKEKDKLIGTVVEIRSLGERRLYVRYRHGQLVVEAGVSPDFESICHTFFA